MGQSSIAVILCANKTIEVNFALCTTIAHQAWTEQVTNLGRD